MNNECHTHDEQFNIFNKTGKCDDKFICGVVEGFYGKPWTFEQRVDLFKRLKQFGLNSFMYAPKDDVKHRAKWRQLYSEQEASELKVLIDEAKECNIDFYYSLAPGLDMGYSDPQDLKTLLAKYDQLALLGCQSFAILFDDIEPNICEKDTHVFKDYASAQVSVSNLVYHHLNCPRFLFCPTEYCESRAVPDVANSNYLNTIGINLHQGIDIMWSGPRVISRLITLESVDVLSRVIRRPPLIWENLHANDYDKRRVFLGPYSGRSTKLISKLRGILTNPNCEYEANYIAIHTLAQWSKCNADSRPYNQLKHSSEPNISISSVSSRYEQNQEQPNCDSVYDPDRALIAALKDWIPHIMDFKNLPDGINLSLRTDSEACEQLLKDAKSRPSEDLEINNIDVDESNGDMMADVTQSSSASTISTNKSDMDTSNSPNRIIDVGLNFDSCDMPDANTPEEPQDLYQRQSHVPVYDAPTMGDKFDHVTMDSVIFKDMLLFIDLFYLPFEHGAFGLKFVNDLKWLLDNSNRMAEVNKDMRARRQDAPMVDEESIISKNSKINDEELTKVSGDGYTSDDNIIRKANNHVPNDSPELWLYRFEKLLDLCRNIIRVTHFLMVDCPNKLISLELQPYISDMHESMTIVMEFLRFLRHRNSLSERFFLTYGSRSNLKAELASNDDQEPWVHRSGLVGDIQRLISSDS